MKLYKEVTVERTNFMPTSRKHYQKRSYKKTVLHALGAVLPGQYYGVIESLMEMHEGQVTCPFAKAAEDTVLVYFNKIDFVNTFGKDQIGEMLDVVKAQRLIKDVAPEELVLRTMHKDKILEMCKPRERVFMDRDTPRRIKKMIMEHQSDDAWRAGERKGAATSPTNLDTGKEAEEGGGATPKVLPKRSMVLPRDKYGMPQVTRAKISQDDDDRLQKIARADF